MALQKNIARVASNGLKTAVVGGGIGLVVGVAHALIKIKNQPDLEENKKSISGGGSTAQKPTELGIPAEFLKNSSLYALCLEFASFRHYSPSSFSEMCTSLDKFCEIENKISTTPKEKTRLAWPITATRYATKAKDNIKLIRKRVADKQEPALLLEFDEISKSIEEEIANTQYNITMESASRAAI